MNKKEIKKYIDSVIWQMAKTMPEIPHEYTITDWNPDKKKSFYDFVKHIRKYGKDEIFYGKKYRYLVIDNYKYWTMGEPVDETTLINREKIKIIHPSHKIPTSSRFRGAGRSGTARGKKKS